ncbi:MAG TPA: ABC transporter permease, partial [Candidatus Synoicihabitans sp.]|nr:ABC transporter permease [Candidatus Synoicihabitans sp.]
ASHVRVNETLKSGARGATNDPSHRRLRHLLIVSQFALALVLLAGAAVMIRGLDRLIHRDAGWRPDGLVTGKLVMPTSISADPDRTLQFYEQLQERIAALPGVESASVDVDLPITGYPATLWFEVEGREPGVPGRRPMVRKNPVSPEYFEMTGIALRQGRTIAPTDRRESPPVAVINAAMARTVFPDGNAIGQRLRLAGQPEDAWTEIVGIVDDVRFLNVNAQPTPFQLYIPLSQETWGYVSVTARAQNPAGAGALVEPMRRVLAELDPDLAFSVLPIPELIQRNVADLRFVGQLLSGFALLGLFLAGLGIYSVTSRAVLQRTSEIGIRLALGAQWHDITRLIVGGGAKLATVGAGVGLVLATILITLLTRAMPGLAGGHTPALAGATVVLVGISLLACWLPARRATKIDPLTALRAE